MNKENPKKNKKSFEYYIAQRKEEFRCQYDHERSWENLVPCKFTHLIFM